MDINVIVDKQSELRMREAADKLEKYCKCNNIKAYNKNIVVIFSNDHNFVRDTAIKLYKNSIIVNVTENLSEQHVINVLKYVSDICYLKTDVNVIASRIICAYNKHRVNTRRNA